MIFYYSAFSLLQLWLQEVWENHNNSFKEGSINLFMVDYIARYFLRWDEERKNGSIEYNVRNTEIEFLVQGNRARQARRKARRLEGGLKNETGASYVAMLNIRNGQRYLKIFNCKDK